MSQANVSTHDVTEDYHPGQVSAPRLNVKLTLLIIIVMISAHFVVFSYFTTYYKRSETKVNRDLTLRQVINTIETVRNTPQAQREQVVDQIFLPNIKVTIDNDATWPLQFKNATLWHVLQKLSSMDDTLSFSLLLDKGRWLNITARTRSASWKLQMILFGLEITIALMIAFSLWSINRFSAPLRKFMDAAERLSIDLNAQPLAEGGPAIVRDTAQAINKMQERISDLIRERTQMLAAISHDLRTPITRLKLRADFIEDPTLFENIMNDLDEMEVMVSETLAFAGDDSKREQKVNLDLNSLLRSLCENMQDTGYNVTYEGAPSRVRFFGRTMAMKRAVTNLITNAIKYGKVADVALLVDETHITIRIQDEGPGLPDDQLQEVFKPFYRAESSRSRETGGAGLGLAVTQDIIHGHDGTITLSCRKDRSGLCALIQFKRQLIARD